MTQYVPLSPVPSQVLTVTLSGQRCILQIDQKDENRVFVSLTCNGVSIVSGRLVVDRVSIARAAYLPFSGKLAFIDTQGKTDPVYTGFGTRYRLAYIP